MFKFFFLIFSDIHVREIASSSIRYFLPPIIQLDANDYTELINWETEPITPPPLLSDLSDLQVNELVKNPEQLVLDAFPIHTIDVERTIKEVSKT